MKKYVILFLAIVFSNNSYASNVPTEIGEYGDWTAYYVSEGKNRVCYMASTPKIDTGNYKKRGDIYAVVTHRPADKTYNVVNFVAGYKYKANSKVVVKVGTTTINNMFTNDENAWAPDNQTDKKLVDVMRRGEKMTVEGVSFRGTKTKDTYSLRGFTNAYRAISAKCGYKL
ncbi:MAG: invasion associated locus B family protein [Alphaproteobacteria bacterium]|nr:invasion associated locus B family protein [Alphaproteobacteria bacterium]